jgi:hypothetical protein
MSRNRFEELFKCVRWSHQPPFQGDTECSEVYRWKLVDNFVKNFNDHRAEYFSPSECICVDVSMSRWYGQGAHWINHGLPQYKAIDRKGFSYNEKGRPLVARRRSFEEEACLKAISSESPKSGVLAHLTPIKRFKIDGYGRETTFRHQGRCKECQIKTTWTCSNCEERGKTVYLCSTRNGKRCFIQHIAKHHTHLGSVGH